MPDPKKAQCRPSIAECKAIIRSRGWSENNSELVIAAATLMENCETEPDVSVDDGLECLNHAGVVAEMGARILYVLTGRDEYGWHGAGYKGLAFHTGKQNWLDYLAQHGA